MGRKKMRNGFSYLTLPPITFVCFFAWFIVLGFNDVSTLVGHFVSSPRERGKGERKRSRGVEKGTGKKMKKKWKWRNGRNKNIPLYSYLLQGWQVLPNCKPVSVGHPSDVRYTTSLPLPTTPSLFVLEFNSPLISILVILSWSVYLTTLPGQAYT